MNPTESRATDRTPAAQAPATTSPQADTQPSDRAPLWKRLVPGLVLIVLVGLAYGNSLQNDFVFDDRPFIKNSEEIHDIRNIPQMFGIGGSMSYRPVRQVSYAIDIWLWGDNPFGFHLTNVILHAVVTLSLFGVVRRLFRSSKLAWITAALFALHPIHTESVTYVSGRKDLLCTLFVLAMLALYQRLMDRWSGMSVLGRAAHGAAIAISFLLALGSKEMALAAIPLLLVLHLLPQIREAGTGRRFADLIADTWRVIARYRITVLAALGVCVVFAVMYFTQTRGTHATWHGGDPWTNFQTVARVQVLYLIRMIAPLRLIGDYHYDTFRVTDSAFDLASIASGLGIGAIVMFLFAMTRRNYIIAAGGLWYFVCLLPVAHIRPHHELVAERFLYLPSIGFCLVLAALAVWLLERVRGRAAVAVIAILLTAYGVRTHVRNRDWRDDLTFWTVTREQSPRNARAHIYYAFNLYYAGKKAEAIQAARHGVEIMPAFYTGNYNLARMYEETGSHAKAIEHYNAEISYFDNEDAYYNLGNLYGRLGRFEESEQTFLKMLERFPASLEVLYFLGLVCEKQGKFKDAWRHYKSALNKSPNHEKSTQGLRRLRLRGGTGEEQTRRTSPGGSENARGSVASSVNAASR